MVKLKQAAAAVEAPVLGDGPICTLKGQALLYPPLIELSHGLTAHTILRTDQKTPAGKKYPREVVRQSFLRLGGWECPKTGDVYGYHVPVVLDREYRYGDEYEPEVYAADASLLLRGDELLAHVMLLDTPAGHKLHHLLATDQFEMFARGTGTDNHFGTVEEYTLVYLMSRLDKNAALSRAKPAKKGAGRGHYRPRAVVPRPMQTAA